MRVANLVLWMAVESGRNEIPATHELIAAMACIRRPPVSLVLADLQRTGAHSTLHGHVHILHPEVLLEAACPCFETRTRILERAVV